MVNLDVLVVTFLAWRETMHDIRSYLCYLANMDTYGHPSVTHHIGLLIQHFAHPQHRSYEMDGFGNIRILHRPQTGPVHATAKDAPATHVDVVPAATTSSSHTDMLLKPICASQFTPPFRRPAPQCVAPPATSTISSTTTAPASSTYSRQVPVLLVHSSVPPHSDPNSSSHACLPSSPSPSSPPTHVYRYADPDVHVQRSHARTSTHSADALAFLARHRIRTHTHARPPSSRVHTGASAAPTPPMPLPQRVVLASTAAPATPHTPPRTASLTSMSMHTVAAPQSSAGGLPLDTTQAVWAVCGPRHAATGTGVHEAVGAGVGAGASVLWTSLEAEVCARAAAIAATAAGRESSEAALMSVPVDACGRVRRVVARHRRDEQPLQRWRQTCARAYARVATAARKAVRRSVAGRAAASAAWARAVGKATACGGGGCTQASVCGQHAEIQGGERQQEHECGSVGVVAGVHVGVGVGMGVEDAWARDENSAGARLCACVRYTGGTGSSASSAGGCGEDSREHGQLQGREEGERPGGGCVHVPERWCAWAPEWEACAERAQWATHVLTGHAAQPLLPASHRRGNALSRVGTDRVAGPGARVLVDDGACETMREERRGQTCERVGTGGAGKSVLGWRVPRVDGRTARRAQRHTGADGRPMHRHARGGGVRDVGVSVLVAAADKEDEKEAAAGSTGNTGRTQDVGQMRAATGTAVKLGASRKPHPHDTSTQSSPPVTHACGYCGGPCACAHHRGTRTGNGGPGPQAAGGATMHAGHGVYARGNTPGSGKAAAGETEESACGRRLLRRPADARGRTCTVVTVRPRVVGLSAVQLRALAPRDEKRERDKKKMGYGHIPKVQSEAGDGTGTVDVPLLALTVAGTGVDAGTGTGTGSAVVSSAQSAPRTSAAQQSPRWKAGVAMEAPWRTVGVLTNDLSWVTM